MRCGPFRSCVELGLLLVACATSWHVRAGGSGLTTVVVANQASSNSVALANYFCERRGVPPGNFLRIDWPWGNTSWSDTDFETYLLGPLLNFLAASPSSNLIDHVVLSMDIPFQVVNSSDGTVNGTTSALFYGVKSAADPGVTNGYAASEAGFLQAKPASAPGYSFLATMLTADSLAQAEQLVDQGAASDGAFPQQPVVLAKSSDPYRNLRYPGFDNAIFNVNLRGASSILRTNTDSILGQTGFLGYETGLTNFSLSTGTFVPGSLADNLTSFGGVIFGPNSQTTLLAFINAGAAGSYGTVAEPGTDTQKFPDPQVYFYQARGFDLAESYYQSLNQPYLGLVVGEPLAAPFRRLASGAWGTNGTPTLAGIANLSVRFSATGGGPPLQQIDLFVDGEYAGTLTNLAPVPGNLLTVAVNGCPVSYTVPANATLSAVAAGLAAQLNDTSVTNVTKTQAFAHGDRVELRSFSTNHLADPFFFTDTTATNGPGLYYSAAFLPSSLPPRLTAVGWDRSGAFMLHVDALPIIPYVIQAAGNLSAWGPIYTNLVGGSMDFVDLPVTNHSRWSYRATVSTADQAAVSPPANPPSVTALNAPTNGGCLLRIDGTSWPYVIQSSPDQSQWTSIFTNWSFAQIQTTASSSAGSAGVLSTYVTASRSSFLVSGAFGIRPYAVFGTPATGAWLQLVVTKTNGNAVSLAVTNQSGSATAASLTAQLCALLNAQSALQGIDGVVAEDFYTNTAGTAFFNLRARSPGLQAAAVQVVSKRSGPPLVISPSGTNSLTRYLSDLQPRNHLYVSAGASRLTAAFELDTTTLPDGFHDLTAVAYEGTSVRTQTPVNLPLHIQNSTLAATLTLLDFTNGAPAAGTYLLRVAANTNTVTAISLYSTGGLLDTIANEPVATFTIDGPFLGAGLHPYYALVQTSDGLKYRTQTYGVRFSN